MPRYVQHANKPPRTETCAQPLPQRGRSTSSPFVCDHNTSRKRQSGTHLGSP
jgi:hypothetical protein